MCCRPSDKQAESQGQGLDALNLAACHACALLPETSCVAFNSLLDRVLLVGDGVTPGYFSGSLALALEAAASPSHSPFL